MGTQTFSIEGSVAQLVDSKQWVAIITLRSADGKESQVYSNPCSTEQEATNLLLPKVEEISKILEDKGATIESREFAH